MDSTSTSLNTWDYDEGISELYAHSLTAIPALHHRNKSKVIPVAVSGKIYYLQQHLFSQLRKLPWTVPSPTTYFFSRLPRNQTQIQYSLRTAPHLFDILLNYVESGSLPKLTTLRTADLEELEPLVMLLQLPILQKHLQLQQWGINMSSVPSFFRKEASDRLWKTASAKTPVDENSDSTLHISSEHSIDTGMLENGSFDFGQTIGGNTIRSKKGATFGDATAAHLNESEEISMQTTNLSSQRSIYQKLQQNEFLQKLRGHNDRGSNHATICASSDAII